MGTAEIMFPDIPTVDATPSPSVNYIFKDLNQTTMLIGHFGIKRTPDFPDYFALRVMNDILGEGGFTSRLMREVREKHGLAYMVGSIMQPATTRILGSGSLIRRPAPINRRSDLAYCGCCQGTPRYTCAGGGAAAHQRFAHQFVCVRF